MSSSSISSSQRRSGSSYRPRNAGHDYYGVGTYLITLVVSERQRLLSKLNDDAKHPAVQLTAFGEIVQQEWERTPGKVASHGIQVAVRACVCMPDHFHGVLEVLAPMPWCLGDIMQSFKAVCTTRWQQLQGIPASVNRPIPADCFGDKAPAWLREKAALHGTEGALLRSLSKRQRQEYYTLVGRPLRPLFDENYDDTVCLDERHREAMIAYVHDNPRRAILRRLMPDVMRRSLHVRIGGRSYGAFGNLHLLRWANRVQVFCHRRHPVSGEPYETTEDYARQRKEWQEAILQGATVLVTPGVSRGEALVKEECLERGYPLIHIQKEPIGPLWKPERRRFEACAQGALLILAPWGLDEMEAVEDVPADTDYSRFHNLNALAAEICTFEGEATLASPLIYKRVKSRE